MHKLKTGSLKDYKLGKTIPHEELLELDVDILYPAALENAISGNNADRIKARIVCELANGPTTPEADLWPRREFMLILIYVPVPEVLLFLILKWFRISTVTSGMRKQSIRDSIKS